MSSVIASSSGDRLHKIQQPVKWTVFAYGKGVVDYSATRPVENVSTLCEMIDDNGCMSGTSYFGSAGLLRSK